MFAEAGGTGKESGAISATLDCSDADECEIEQWSSAVPFGYRAIDHQSSQQIRSAPRMAKADGCNLIGALDTLCSKL